MDLAKQKSQNFFAERFIGYLFYIPGVWLIIHTIAIWRNTAGLVGFPSIDALNDFRKYRDVFYVSFVLTGVLLGIVVSLNKATSLKRLIPNLVVGIILVTFSYAVAGVVIDVLNAISKII